MLKLFGSLECNVYLLINLRKVKDETFEVNQFVNTLFLLIINKNVHLL